jgi:hypothetical protein
MSPALPLALSEGLVSSVKLSAIVLLLATAAAGYAQDGVIPERFAIDRYQKLMSDPPFAVSAVVNPPPPKIDWAEQFYLSGASRFVENGTEKDWVYINDKSDPGGAFQLYGTEPNAQGIQIVKLDWHPENPAITKVTLKKGAEFATLERDKVAFTGPPPTAPPQRGPVIHRVPPAHPTLPQPAPNGTKQGQGSERRNIQVIKSR